MGFTEDFKRIVKEAALTKFNGDTDLAQKACVAQSAVSMLNNNKRSGLQLETIGKLLDAIGAKIICPEDSPHCDTDALFIENEKLKQANEQLKADLYRKEGAIAVLKEQLADIIRDKDSLQQKNTSHPSSQSNEGKTA